MNNIGNILKKIIKIVVGFTAVVFLLYTIYLSIDYIAKDFLSFSSRAVLSNFIVFALIIFVVLKQVVHPKAMLEQIQTSIENQIKEAENTKIQSQAKLNDVEKLVSNIEGDITSIIEKSKQNAQLIGEKIINEAESSAQIIKENSEKTIESNKILVKNELLKKASLASVEVARKHIVDELSWNQGLHEKLIDESVEAIKGVDF